MIYKIRQPPPLLDYTNYSQSHHFFRKLRLVPCFFGCIPKIRRKLQFFRLYSKISQKIAVFSIAFQNFVVISHHPLKIKDQQLAIGEDEITINDYGFALGEDTQIELLG